MIKLEMESYNMILIKKLPEYQPYNQANFNNKNILQVKKYYHLIKNR